MSLPVSPRLASCNRNAAGSQGIIERGEVAATVTEKTVGAAGVDVTPDDLASIVDAVQSGAIGGRGIVERGEVAATVTEKAVGAGGVTEIPDDRPLVVDAECLGAIGGQGCI